MANEKPPDFWEVFAEALHASARNRSWLAFVPWSLGLCVALPVGVVFILSRIFPISVPDGAAIPILSSIAVVAGFFGSVSVATMTQVQRMASEFPFSRYLKDMGLFDQYLFWPQFTLLFQIALLLFSVIAALSVHLVTADLWNKYLVALDVGLLVYVCTKTWNLVDLVRKLTWHYEEYTRLSKEYQARSK